MSKKSRKSTIVEEASISAEHNSSEPALPAQPSECRPLMDEVQAFLTMRTELAKKVAEEIEATERKLADLKKTAAMLVAETSSSVAKEKKPKKLKVKTPGRGEASASELPPTEAVA